ncbi:UNVERIFIED_ORG: hypothetical protein GGD59_006626 [Rhizobium esperanzae]
MEPHKVHCEVEGKALRGGLEGIYVVNFLPGIV